MLCCLSLPSDQNGQEMRLSFQKPHSLYLVECLAYSRHSVIICGRNEERTHVKIRGKVQSCTADGKIIPYQGCLPTPRKRGFTCRFGNFLQTHAVSPPYLAGSKSAGRKYVGEKNYQEISKKQNLNLPQLNAMPNSCESSGG